MNLTDKYNEILDKLPKHESYIINIFRLKSIDYAVKKALREYGYKE